MKFKFTFFFTGVMTIALLSMSCTKKTGPAGYAVEPVSMDVVRINDAFWTPRREANRAVSLKHCFDRFTEYGDFDSPKLIEGGADMIRERPDPELEAYLDDKIDKVLSNLHPRLEDPDLAVGISGHFLEAAAAYYEATGKGKMLDAALRMVDAVAAAYGPEKKTYISGHQSFKLGLIRLFRLTGDERYWRLAKFFLDERGRDDYLRAGEYAIDRTYAQDHKPVVDQVEAVGHAVRATFQYIPMTDIAALSNEEAYFRALDKIWNDMVTRKMYLTGGIGSVRFHEKFGAAYELPNLSAWNETCAAFGSIVWNHRLFLLHGDARYIDVLERTLYNGFLAGVSLAGDRFFYQNPLMSYGNYERFEWINVPCCPPNVVRLLAALGDYIYARTDSGIYVNLYIAGSADVDINGQPVTIRQETHYPWEGTVRIAVEPDKPGTFTLFVRIPGWTGRTPVPGDLYTYLDGGAGDVIITLNGEKLTPPHEKGYALIRREWQEGDVVELTLPMPVRRVTAHDLIQDNAGRVALVRGPLVYCAEWPDNGGSALNIVVADDADLSSEFRPGLFEGTQVVTGRVSAVRRGPEGVSIVEKPHPLVAIPYFLWANRGAGEMNVWLPRSADKAWLPPVPPEPIVRVTAVGAVEKAWTGYNDQNDALSAVYDGVEPLNSGDESSLYFRMRPPEGQPAVIEYAFKEAVEVSSASVYWVDDRRFCRPPASWRILYKSGTEWKPVALRGDYGVEKDVWNTAVFDPVLATAVRLEIEPKSILYRAGEIGPPGAMFLDEDVTWRECGVIEFRVETRKSQ